MRHHTKRTATTRAVVAGALAVGVVAVGASTASATPHHRPSTERSATVASGGTTDPDADRGRPRHAAPEPPSDRPSERPSAHWSTTDAGERPSRWQRTDARGALGATGVTRSSTSGSADTAATTASASPATSVTSTATTAGTSGGLSGLSGNAEGIRRLVLERWPALTSFSGYRAGAGDHGTGHAVDVMIPSWTTASGRAQGQAVADYVRAHASELGVTYVIWRQHIWSVARADEGWRLMEDRGSATQNHDDHVHVSVS
ncbi:hypothetical protein DFJ68_2416 [Terracoccus luteus]|uniref:ARB-07466-like C-terminal domain-containing protein n=1 Tax=Terracoccus luteus TaxID=53356 RepID=A0A495XYE9_9MICO|nr:hypothetical protein [Terracoccus luteus]RKT78962.1 hypothetical protein DFJ68_2416 [Terracoccus luteus]